MLFSAPLGDDRGPFLFARPASMSPTKHPGRTCRAPRPSRPCGDNSRTPRIPRGWTEPCRHPAMLMAAGIGEDARDANCRSATWASPLGGKAALAGAGRPRWPAQRRRGHRPWRTSPHRPQQRHHGVDQQIEIERQYSRQDCRSRRRPGCRAIRRAAPRTVQACRRSGPAFAPAAPIGELIELIRPPGAPLLQCPPGSASRRADIAQAFQGRGRSARPARASPSARPSPRAVVAASPSTIFGRCLPRRRAFFARGARHDAGSPAGPAPAAARSTAPRTVKKAAGMGRFGWHALRLGGKCPSTGRPRSPSSSQLSQSWARHVDQLDLAPEPHRHRRWGRSGRWNFPASSARPSSPAIQPVRPAREVVERRETRAAT